MLRSFELHFVMLRSCELHFVMLRNCELHFFMLRCCELYFVMLRSCELHFVMLRSYELHFVMLKSCELHFVMLRSCELFCVMLPRARQVQLVMKNELTRLRWEFLGCYFLHFVHSLYPWKRMTEGSIIQTTFSEPWSFLRTIRIHLYCISQYESGSKSNKR